MEILKFHVNILQQYSAFTHLSPAMLSLLKDNQGTPRQTLPKIGMLKALGNEVIDCQIYPEQLACKQLFSRDSE